MKNTFFWIIDKFLKSNVFWNLIGIIFFRGSIVVLGIFVARSNDISEYGLYAFLMLCASMIISVVGSSLQISTISTFAGQVSEVSKFIYIKYLYLISLISFVFSLGLYFSGKFLLYYFKSQLVGDTLYGLVVLYVALSLILSGIQGIFNANKLFREVAIFQIAFSIFIFMGAVLFGSAIDAIWLTLGFSTSIIIPLMLLYLFIEKKSKFSISILEKNNNEREFFSKLKQSFFPVFLSALLVAPAHWACTTILYFTSHDAAEVALFSTAIQWFVAASILPIALANVAYPNQVRGWGEKSTTEISIFLKRSILKNFKIMIFLSIALIGLSGLLVSAYRFPQRDAWIVFAVAFSTSLFLAIQLPAANQLLAAKKFRVGFIMNAVWLVLYLFLALLFRENGALGFIFAMLIAYGIHAAYTLYYVFRRLLV